MAIINIKRGINDEDHLKSMIKWCVEHHGKSWTNMTIAQKWTMVFGPGYENQCIQLNDSEDYMNNIITNLSRRIYSDTWDFYFKDEATAMAFILLFQK